MPFAPHRRRVAAVILVATALLAPVVAFSPSSADPIADKQAEAAKIAAQLEQLQHQAEVYSEQYDAAVVALQDVQAKVGEAAKRVDAANADIAVRRHEVARYALGAYVRGGDSGVLPLMLNSNGLDIGQRQGYVTAAIGNREDLINQLNAARDEAQHDIVALNDAKTKAQAAKDAVE